MRSVAVISQTFFLILLLAYTACEPPSTRRSRGEIRPQVDSKSPTHIDKTTDTQNFSGYAPAKIDVMPLTEFIETADSPKLKIYVSLLDSFGCQMKSPGIFRFELYEWILRSPEPRGRRVIIWPDIDLTNPAKNNQYWKDFLRAYEFNLAAEPQAGQSYILQATFFAPDGRRLLAEFNFK